MLTARRYRNQASKPVILSIGSRLKGNAFDLPVPCEIGRGFDCQRCFNRLECLRLRSNFFKQRPCRFEIGRVKTLGKSLVGRRKQLARLFAPALVAPYPPKAGGGA